LRRAAAHHALEDNDANLRHAVAEALWKIGYPRVEASLIAFATKDKSEECRQVATEALSIIGAPAVEPLIVLPSRMMIIA
jgi:HEAT repeat protein